MKRCGTETMYKLGCRCPDCVHASRIARGLQRSSKRGKPYRPRVHPIFAPHGKLHTYLHLGCRCALCREANRVANAAARARRRSRAPGAAARPS